MLTPREPAITDDMRAAVALRHLIARDRARGNAEAREDESLRELRAGLMFRNAAAEWAHWWRKREREHEAEALAIIPSADSYDHAPPAFVGGAT